MSKNWQSELEKAANAIKSSDTISFNSYITNEEAMILQNLKEQTGIKLVNSDAYGYQSFLAEYSKTSGRSLYSATTETLEQSDTVIMVGTRVSLDNTLALESTLNAVTKNDAKFIYMHPIDDTELEKSYNQFVKYEAGSEEGVIALLASFLIKDLPASYVEFFEELDIGNLSGDCSVGEEEVEAIVEKLVGSKNSTLIIGEDFYEHKNARNIAKIVGLIDRCTDLNVMLIPSQTNTIGVSLICDLTKEAGEKVVGYNTVGDFVISNDDKGDINIPVLNQQEGTFVNIDKKVVSANCSSEVSSYCLNDITNQVLGLSLDYVNQLPEAKGFKNSSHNNLEENGYSLEESLNLEEDVSIEEISEIDTYNGVVIYRCKPVHQDAINSKKLSSYELVGSTEFAKAAKITSGDHVNITYNGKTITRQFTIEKSIKGTIGLCPTYEELLEDGSVNFGYRFKQIQIEKIDKEEKVEAK